MLQDSHKDAGLRFEEEDTCVHASKPSSDAVDAVDFDSASEGDPEASSLVGSVSSALPLDCIQYLRAAAHSIAGGASLK